jgi:glycosyltransferase involved in cell wall biosynthesis
MRIYITSIRSVWSPAFGGGPMYVDELARRLQARGADVHVVYTRPTGQRDGAPDYPVSWVAHSDHVGLNAWPIALEMRRLCSQRRPDICFATGAEGGLLPLVVGGRCPLVYGEFHPFLPHSFSIEWRQGPASAARQLSTIRFFRSTRHLARRSSHVITTSEFIRREAISTYGLSPDAVTAIPTGVNTSVFRPPAVPRCPGPPAFACVARLDATKGIDVLLRAFARVRQVHASASLTLVGGGEQRPFRTLAAELALAEHVRFAGQLPAHADVAEVIRQSDVLVLPSRVEGFGNVLLEAMASRVAVVASAVGGIPEIVSDGVTGLLVQPGDEVQLAGALLKLAEDHKLRGRLAAEGHRQVTDGGRFSWEASVDAHCRLFQRLAGQPV